MPRNPDPERATTPLRAALSRDRVLDAAIALADAEGIGAVSMRRIAASLGVEAMSLYHYVKSKDELLGAILDRVLAELVLPPVTTPWKEALRETALSAHAILDRHRWAASVLMTPGASSQTRMRWMEAVLAALAAAGLPPGLADHAYHALDSYVIGFTLWQSSIPYTTAQLAELAQDYLAAMPLDTLPHTATHIRWHLENEGGTGPRAFEAGLDMFLDGLELARTGLGASEAAARATGGPST